MELERSACPKCGSDDYRLVSIVYGADGKADSLRCSDCGHRWEDTRRYQAEVIIVADNQTGE